jgi:alpha-aminoadipate/glutamate carrier protein LysW
MQWDVREEAAVPNCPECETELDIDVNEAEEGDIVTCEECGAEYEIVALDPIEMARLGEDYDEEEDDFEDEDEEDDE